MRAAVYLTALAAPALAAKSSGCGTSTSLKAGTTTKMTGKYGGVTRTWYVYLPKSYSSSRAYPLIVSTHGWGGDGPEDEDDSGLLVTSGNLGADGFIAVYPDGRDDNSLCRDGELNHSESCVSSIVPQPALENRKLHFLQSTSLGGRDKCAMTRIVHINCRKGPFRPREGVRGITREIRERERFARERERERERGSQERERERERFARERERENRRAVFGNFVLGRGGRAHENPQAGAPQLPKMSPIVDARRERDLGCADWGEEGSVGSSFVLARRRSAAEAAVRAREAADSLSREGFVMARRRSAAEAEARGREAAESLSREAARKPAAHTSRFLSADGESFASLGGGSFRSLGGGGASRAPAHFARRVRVLTTPRE